MCQNSLFKNLITSVFGHHLIVKICFSEFKPFLNFAAVTFKIWPITYASFLNIKIEFKLLLFSNPKPEICYETFLGKCGQSLILIDQVNNLSLKLLAYSSRKACRLYAQIWLAKNQTNIFPPKMI